MLTFSVYVASALTAVVKFVVNGMPHLVKSGVRFSPASIEYLDQNKSIFPWAVALELFVSYHVKTFCNVLHPKSSMSCT